MKSRKTAFQLLCRVFLKGEYASLTLRSGLKNVEVKQRPLITRRVYTLLQHQMWVRANWQRFVAKMPSDKVSLFLDFCLSQLFYESQPDYAVVSANVELAKTLFDAQTAAFVNALLKKVIAAGAMEIPLDTTKAVSLYTSHPLWIIELWSAHYGFEKAKAMALFDNEVKPQGLRVDTRKITRQEVLQSSEYEAGSLSPLCVLTSKNPLLLDLVKEKKLFVQDQASQLPMLWLSPKPGQRILDLCAAPGTKSIQAGILMADQGEIIAMDINEKRLELVKQSAMEAELSCIQTLCGDATKVYEFLPPAFFDGVLADVPCSGLGVLGHKPDLRYRISPEDIDSLVHLQSEILAAAGRMVKHGGTLVYSTCTINKKENQRQVQAFLSAHPDFVLIEELQLFADERECDGFYLAKLLHRAKIN